jgi:hypothetical protein
MELHWTKEIYEKFVDNALLSDDEKDVLYTRVYLHWSQIKQSQKLCMSLAKINRLLKTCKIKYDEVQKNESLNLPKRRTKNSDLNEDTLKF